MNDANESQFLFFRSDDGAVHVNVRLEGETVWLTQAAMAALFGVAPQNITMHLQNVYAEGELNSDATCKDFLQVQMEGARNVSRKLKHYNLDAIIAMENREPREKRERNERGSAKK